MSLVADRASPVRLTFGQDQVVVEAQTEGRARAAEAVAASFEGDEPAIAFNPHYLLDGLRRGRRVRAWPGRRRAPRRRGGPPADPGRIRLEFTSPAKPALITWAGDEGLHPEEPPPTPAFRYLVVPLRVPARA